VQVKDESEAQDMSGKVEEMTTLQGCSRSRVFKPLAIGEVEKFKITWRAQVLLRCSC